ncbi:hypothetical protein [Magnetospirillum aberrantis]|uniref:Uncharacterized protein n=1 Tax=Magnetospirillum aberrantis SpK TaxID=908842 RepID=A0A7C9UWI1_9PROT|nr:hypothetical protein [Magnetospirillum aberrantis]NFV80410.1 hypothetical protein [Magnetospirillum aberrantis SpK]
MNKTLLLLALPLALAACADERLAPAPGEHPGWPQPSPPQPTYAPLPFTDTYAPHSGSTVASPPADANGNIPYAVRGQTQTLPQWQEPQPQSAEPHPGTE